MDIEMAGGFAKVRGGISVQSWQQPLASQNRADASGPRGYMHREFARPSHMDPA